MGPNRYPESVERPSETESEPDQSAPCSELDHVDGDPIAFLVLHLMQKRAFGGLKRRRQEAARQGRTLTPAEDRAIYHGCYDGIACELDINHKTAGEKVRVLRRYGFLVPIKGMGNRDAAKDGGKWQTNHYEVLNHDMWAARYGPDACASTKEDKRERQRQWWIKRNRAKN